MSINHKELVAPFDADQIEWKPGPIGFNMNGEPWMVLLAYVDARAVHNRLDSVLGYDKWSNKLIRLADGGGFVCELSIEVEDGKWITKSAASGDTDFEEIKGGDSRSFVRAASLWGIGRYLYDIPRVFAVFVERGTQGARKMKHDGKEYYWVVPDEAHQIASGEVIEIEEKPAPQAPKQKGPAPVPTADKYPSVFPSVGGLKMGAPRKPGSRGGFQKSDKPQGPATRQYQQNRNNPGDYVVPFGESQGKKLSDHTMAELQSLESWLSKVRTPKGAAASCIKALEAFLGRTIGA